mmetsp:Transcript_47026/g.134565  ORF Transcript_47026/g.134565 Transcript_47026/m.134565 type:complete len:384 (+) Transcript_47026:259-1410(+)
MGGWPVARAHADDQRPPHVRAPAARRARGARGGRRRRALSLDEEGPAPACGHRHGEPQLPLLRGRQRPAPPARLRAAPRRPPQHVLAAAERLPAPPDGRGPLPGGRRGAPDPHPRGAGLGEPPAGGAAPARGAAAAAGRRAAPRRRRVAGPVRGARQPGVRPGRGRVRGAAPGRVRLPLPGGGALRGHAHRRRPPRGAPARRRRRRAAPPRGAAGLAGAAGRALRGGRPRALGLLPRLRGAGPEGRSPAPRRRPVGRGRLLRARRQVRGGHGAVQGHRRLQDGAHVPAGLGPALRRRGGRRRRAAAPRGRGGPRLRCRQRCEPGALRGAPRRLGRGGVLDRPGLTSRPRGPHAQRSHLPLPPSSSSSSPSSCCARQPNEAEGQ